MSDELIHTLRQANHYYTKKAADLIEAQADRIERLDARIVELKTESKIWWDQNLKNKIACQRMDDRIAELEAALERIADTDPDEGTEWFHDVARAALGGVKQ